MGIGTCPVCSARRVRFDPLANVFVETWRRTGFRYGIDDFETLNASRYTCRSCGSSDRERLIALWITRHAPGASSLLDVGPGAPLGAFLRGRYRYTSIDADDGADVRGDVQALPFADASFDAFVCSHVLEHINDDRLGLAELRRVLGPGGWGIVLVPICLAASATTEDPDVEENEAWRRFGQGDHVRLYDRAGFIERLETARFAVAQWRPRVLDSLRHGVGRGSVLYVVS